MKQQPYYMHQDPLKLFEKSLQQSQQVQMEKNLKAFGMEPFSQNPSEVQKMQDFAWDYGKLNVHGYSCVTCSMQCGIVSQNISDLIH